MRAAGHDTTIPNLVDAARSGDPSVFVRAAVDATGSLEDVVLVGHSGAGAVLPLIAAGLSARPVGVVFVDAGLPPDGPHPLAGGFLATLRDLTTDGVLPKWSEWWGEDILTMLIANAERRREISAEMHLMPVAFYEATISVPAGWHDGACCYLLLSEAYRRDAHRALSLGWPLAERLGGHFDIVNDGDEVGDLILGLVDHR